MENAVIIHGASNSREGVMAEYKYISNKFGQIGIDWNLKMQGLIYKDYKQYDEMEIELKDGTRKKFYFEVTEFYNIFGQSQKDLMKYFKYNTKF